MNALLERSTKIERAIERIPVIGQRLYVVMGRKRYEVLSLVDAAARWCAFRDTSMAGCSEIGNGVAVYCDNQKVAHISYNGRIWEPGSKYFY